MNIAGCIHLFLGNGAASTLPFQGRQILSEHVSLERKAWKNSDRSLGHLAVSLWEFLLLCLPQLIAGNKHNNNKKKLKPFRYSCATHTASLHTAWWHAVIGADCCTLKFYTENNTKNVPISKGSYHFFRKSESNT